MIHRALWLCSCLSLLVASPALANGSGDEAPHPGWEATPDEELAPKAPPHGLRLEVPLLDAPFNLQPAYTFPGTQQALGLSASAYNAMFFGLSKLTDLAVRPGDEAWRYAVREGAYNAAAMLLMLTTARMPLSEVWLHEEFHLSILRANGIDGVNETNRPGSWFAEGPVRIFEVDDLSLARLKEADNASMVRAAAAGVEGQLQLVERMQRDEFFFGRMTSLLTGRAIFYLWTTLGITLYMKQITSGALDEVVDERRAVELDVASRDFIGPDFTAWVVDLHRPNQTYTQTRGGRHVSGSGAQRYIKWADLTDEEQRYLSRVSNLTLLNFVDPNMLGLSAFSFALRGDRELRAMANLKTYLTPFGYSVNLNAMLDVAGRGVHVTLLNQFNRERYHPGLSLELVRWRLPLGRRALYYSPRVAAWLQPVGQRFGATEMRPGGALELGGEVPLIGPLSGGLSLGAKSVGWMAGNPYLDATAYGTLDLAATF